MTRREKQLMEITMQAKCEELIEDGLTEEEAVKQATEYAEGMLEDIADQKMGEQRDER